MSETSPEPSNMRTYISNETPGKTTYEVLNKSAQDWVRGLQETAPAFNKGATEIKGTSNARAHAIDAQKNRPDDYLKPEDVVTEHGVEPASSDSGRPTFAQRLRKSILNR
ncbi:hypothetical protein C4564_01500 [Candidatus Microgenomates bacterium]|nr:MAG: hypothetical protein C4564_01500 [Candidatus Microgenomates bacterium]